MDTSGVFRSATVAAAAALLTVPLIALALTISRPLCVGDSGADVTALQQFLKEVGFFTYPTATGYYGPYTQAAVTALQHDLGLPQTGCLDAKTEAIVNTFLSNSSATGTGTSTTAFDYIGTWDKYAPSGYVPGYGGSGQIIYPD
jgi:peptidoglycan hydrolase-like protein with peptidoglycan-binding domain